MERLGSLGSSADFATYARAINVWRCGICLEDGSNSLRTNISGSVVGGQWLVGDLDRGQGARVLPSFQPPWHPLIHYVSKFGIFLVDTLLAVLVTDQFL